MYWTMETGVRELERCFDKIFRKVIIDSEINSKEKYVINDCCDYKNNPSMSYLLDYYKSLFVSFKEELLCLKQECINFFENYGSNVRKEIVIIGTIKGYENLSTSVKKCSCER